MADKPIIFSAPMVKAILAGRKSQTRRLLKLPTKTHSGGPIYERNDMGGWAATTIGGHGCFTIDKAGNKVPSPERPAIWHQTTGMTMALPYAPGDRLYVREHWRTADAYDDLSPSQMGGEEPVIYLADDTLETWGWRNDFVPGRFRQAMHMPRWASRLTLTVTDVRVQRLTEISDADAIAEGIDITDACEPSVTYAKLWDEINAKRGFPWQINPWVVALTFRTVLNSARSNQ